MHIFFFLSCIILNLCLQLRQSLVLGEHDTFDEYKSKAVDEDNGYDSEDDYSGPEFDMPENTFMNEDVAYMNEDVGIPVMWLAKSFIPVNLTV